jgi:hypothetical protein
MRHHPARTLVVLALGALAIVGLSSVASAQTLTPAQEQGLAEARALVEETCRLYALPQVGVSPAPWLRSSFRVAGMYSHRGWLFLDPGVLGTPIQIPLVAALLGHRVLDWERIGRRSFGQDASGYRKAREEMNLDAQAKAVEILVRVKGWPERRALEAIYTWLLRQHHAQTRGGQEPVGYHRVACQEIGDLLARFPQHRAWAAGLECGPI